ncbi:hypothetical protein Tco_0485777, partial [Tanacetum coccineum]
MTGGQQRGIISPFGAMHAGSYLLARQPRGVLSVWGVMPLFIPLADGVYKALRCYAQARPFDFSLCGILCLSMLCTLAHPFLWGILGLLALCTLAHPGCVNIVRGIPDGLASSR